MLGAKSSRDFCSTNYDQWNTTWDLSTISPTSYASHGEWTDLIFSDRGLEISLSICYAAFDTADLWVQMYSETNRTEPTPTFTPGSPTAADYSSIAKQLSLRDRNTSVEGRGIMTLQAKRSWLPDESDDRLPGIIALAASFTYDTGGQGLNTSMSSFYCGVNSVYCGIFQGVITTRGSGGLPYALQAVITTLTSHAYYDLLLPTSDEFSNLSQIMFVQALTPSLRRGFWAVMAALSAHLIVVTVITITFLIYTKFSVLDNAWQAVAQLQGEQTKDILAMASMAEDKQIKKWIEERGEARQLVGVGIMVGDERVGLNKLE
jgi:hypothetical protein